MNAVGGNFTTSASIRLEFVGPTPSASIYFGINGTQPNTLYSGPFVINYTTKISAVARGSSVPVNLPSFSLWYKTTASDEQVVATIQ